MTTLTTYHICSPVVRMLFFLTPRGSWLVNTDGSSIETGVFHLFRWFCVGGLVFLFGGKEVVWVLGLFGLFVCFCMGKGLCLGFFVLKIIFKQKPRMDNIPKSTTIHMTQMHFTLITVPSKTMKFFKDNEIHKLIFIPNHLFSMMSLLIVLSTA